jgi:uncharacterized alpha-E superfamily protein
MMMLSRVADDLFWTARYLERGADLVRLLEVSYLLDLDRPENTAPQWEPLVWITGDMPFFRERYGAATRDNVIRFLTQDADYANSVTTCITQARTNAKGLREQLPTALWEELNALWLVAQRLCEPSGAPHTQILAHCHEIRRLHTLILGLVSEGMTRGTGYRLWQVGTYLERADKTSRMLHVKYFYLLPSLAHVGTIIDDAQWSALLQSLGAWEDFHRQHGLITADGVIGMIVSDPDFTRSIAFCLNEARRNLAALPDMAQSPAAARLAALCGRVARLSGADIIAFGVHEFINSLQLELNRVNDALMLNIFPPAPPAQENPQ